MATIKPPRRVINSCAAYPCTEQATRTLCNCMGYKGVCEAHYVHCAGMERIKRNLSIESPK